MRFYTGIALAASNLHQVNTIFTLIKRFIPHITYWKALKHAIQILEKKPTSLNPYDEFLVTLMRLRLGLLNEGVANHFDISPTKSSFIFTTWIKLLSKLLKNLVAQLPPEAVRDNWLEEFIKTGNNKCRNVESFQTVQKFLLKDQNYWIVKLQPGLIVNNKTP